MIIEVDRKLCMGAGECVYSAPETLALDEDSKAIVIKHDGNDFDAIRAAVRGCPNFALKLRSAG